jgi:hypothetical protein
MIPVEITDQDIEAIGTFLDRDFSEEAFRNAFKERGSIDVQAAPGSGKTTLLVAKLALFSERWPYAGRGVCVLSHTNVARAEVEKQLAKHPTASALLGYPHFIGTIQSFAHEFLALPYLRGFGLHPRIVDNDRFAAAAKRIAGSIFLVKNHLDRHPHTATKTLSTLRFSGPNLDLMSDAALPAPDTKTFKAFENLKLALAKDGIFRFDDMLAIAQQALAKIPALRKAVSRRFPIIFFDEMQDTDGLQEALIDATFEDQCIIQRFGDRNQGIFDNDQDNVASSFPKKGYIDLARSRRFGRQIAATASTLTIAQPQQIAGNPDRPEKAHTIFLFDELTIGKVLPAFGQLILEQFPGELGSDFVAKAVGCRKTGSGKNPPRHIGDYWSAFDASQTSRSSGLATLIEYVRRARSLVVEHGHLHTAAPVVWDGVFAFLHSHSCKLRSGELIARKSILRQLEDDEPHASPALQKLVRDLCLGPEPTEGTWPQTVGTLTSALQCILPEAVGDAREEFLIWNDRPAGAHAGQPAPRNVYEHKDGGRRVSIDLNTIHGVKGETHNATLVVTTATSQVFDLREALPSLSGTGKARDLKSLPKQLMTLFVGITRPRDLLCLAVVGDHCTKAQHHALLARGWEIRDLREPKTA